MLRKLITLFILTIFVATGLCFVASPTARALKGYENPEIADLAEQMALEQGYGHKVPVKVGGKTYAYNDTRGITDAILALANATGNEAVAMSASRIGGCHLLTMNGNWFTNIDKASNAEFYEAFPGHSLSDYNAAKKKAQNKINEIFAQLCKERGLDENGYPPKAEPTPKPTVAPAPTPKPTVAPAPTPKPTTAPAPPAPTPKPTAKPTPKPKATESPKAEGSPKATEKPKATQTPEPAPSAVASSDTNPSPSMAPEPSVSAAAEPVATPPAASVVQTVQVDMSEARPSLNGQNADDKPAAVTVLSASTVADSGDTVTIELKTSELPEGTASIKTPDGEIVRINGAEGIKFSVNKSDLNDNGQVEILALDNEGTPLGAYMVQAEVSSSTPGLLWLWIAIGVIVAVAAICVVIIVKKKQALKAE